MWYVRRALDEMFNHDEKDTFLFAYDLVRGFKIANNLNVKENIVYKYLKDECNQKSGSCYNLCARYKLLEEELIKMENEMSGKPQEFENTKTWELRNLSDDINRIVCANLFYLAYNHKEILK